jgi:hypothetical protein
MRKARDVLREGGRMKGKVGPSFFDVLRTTMKQELNPAPAVEENPPQGPPPASPPLPVAPAAIPKHRLRPVVEAPPEPPRAPVEPLKPIVSADAESEDPDRRIFHVSQTTALFGLLVGLIALLVAFYAGIQVGRSGQPAKAVEANRESTPTPPAPTAVQGAIPPPVPTVDPTPPPPKFTIMVMSWPAGDRVERERAERNASFFANYLSEKGFEDLAIVPGGNKITLFMGKFASNSAPEARKVLDAVRAVQYSTGSNPPRRFFQRADFVPLAQRQP